MSGERVPDTSRLLTLFDAGDRYMIPTYQRGYSWEAEHVNELLEDLEYAHDPNNEVSEHFFGTILLTKNEERPEVMKVIDGQQRLTTVTLFLICARNFFFSYGEKSDTAKKYCERLGEYIYKDQKKPVLILSRTNKNLFEDIIEPRELMQAFPRSYSESNDSNEKLTNAYKTIRSWIKKHADENNDMALKTIYGYVRTLFEKFMVYKYHYESEKKAYDVFNLVNNRGVNLDESDLIKNYMFGKMADQTVEENVLDGYDERWDEMRRNVTGKKKGAGYQLDRFFYHYLLTFHGDKFGEGEDEACFKPKNLHEKYGGLIGIKAFSSHMKRGSAVDPKALIEDMVFWSDNLNQIRNPTKKLFRNHTIHYLEKIKDINAVFVYPAILAGYKKYWLEEDRAQFEALVMMCFKYHVRVKVIGTTMSLGEYQDIMCKIKNKINCGDTVKKIICELVKNEKEYPGHTRIEQNLLEFRISNSKLAVALLEEAEYGYRDERSQSCVSVEHIMPRNFKAWKDDPDKCNPGKLSDREFHSQHVSLLGNQTLWSQKKNSTASDKPFKVKQDNHYAKEDTYKMTKRLADAKKYPVWNGEAIKTRQKELTEAILQTIDLLQLVDKCKI